MRVPQNHQTPGFKRFVVGLILGMILGWVFFIALSGIAQERQLSEIQKQKVTIKQLQEQLKTWQEDSVEKNKKLEKKLTVQNIEIEIANKERAPIGKLGLSELEADVKDQLSESLLKKNIENVAASKKLVIQAVESNIYTVDKNKYRLKVKSLVIYSTIELAVSVEKVK